MPNYAHLIILNHCLDLNQTTLLLDQNTHQGRSLIQVYNITFSTFSYVGRKILILEAIIDRNSALWNNIISIFFTMAH